MSQQELFPPDVAVMVAQLAYHETHGWTLTTASRPCYGPSAFGDWTTYGPMTYGELISLLPDLVWHS